MSKKFRKYSDEDHYYDRKNEKERGRKMKNKRKGHLKQKHAYLEDGYEKTERVREIDADI